VEQVRREQQRALALQHELEDSNNRLGQLQGAVTRVSGLLAHAEGHAGEGN